MRLGVVILPEHPWAQAQSLWRRAEEMGFAHLWTYDHLAWRSLRDSPWYGAVPTLTAAALATQRACIGTLVASPNFRHPVAFSRDLLALDDVSGGRFTLGMGAGGAGWDAAMLGQPSMTPAERMDRFEEFVELTDRLLTTRRVSYRGQYYTADEARTYPGCVQEPRIPFVIAATGRRGMVLAARYAAGWVTTGARESRPGVAAAEGARQVAAQLKILAEACTAIGRDPATIDRMVLAGPVLDQGLEAPSRLAETVDRYEEIGVTDFIVHWPRPSDPYRGDEAAFEAAVAPLLSS